MEQLKERVARRSQLKIIEYASKSRENFEIDTWFFTISNSEYCTDSLSYIQYQMDFDEYMELVDQVSFYSDLKRASEEDHKREQSKQDAINRQTRGAR